jgi:hypothetical protein
MNCDNPMWRVQHMANLASTNKLARSQLLEALVYVNGLKEKLARKTKERNDMTICRECFFYKEHLSTEEEEHGQCHRYPPVLDTAYASWKDDSPTESPCAYVQPLVDFDDWCGEWRENRFFKEKKA